MLPNEIKKDINLINEEKRVSVLPEVEDFPSGKNCFDKGPMKLNPGLLIEMHEEGGRIKNPSL